MKLKNILKILTIILIICSCFAIDNDVRAAIFDGNRADMIENLGYIWPYQHRVSNNVDFVSFELLENECAGVEFEPMDPIDIEITDLHWTYDVNMIKFNWKSGKNTPIVAKRTALSGEPCYIKIKMAAWVANTAAGLATDYDKENIFIVDYEKLRNYRKGKREDEMGDLDASNDLYELIAGGTGENNYIKLRNGNYRKPLTGQAVQEGIPVTIESELKTDEPIITITKIEEEQDPANVTLSQANSHMYKAIKTYNERTGDGDAVKRTFEEKRVDVPWMIIKIDFTNSSAQTKMENVLGQTGTNKDYYAIAIAGYNGVLPFVTLKPMENNKIQNRMTSILGIEDGVTQIDNDKYTSLANEVGSIFGVTISEKDCFGVKQEGDNKFYGWFENFAKGKSWVGEILEAKQTKTVTSYNSAGESFSYKFQQGHLYTVRYYSYYDYIGNNGYIALHIDEVDETGTSIETNENALSMRDVADRIQQHIRMSRIDLAAIAEERTEWATFTDVLAETDAYRPESLGEAPQATRFIGTTLRVVTNIGIIVAIVMLAILGIKYMLGSIEEKAEYKRDLLPYMIGAVLLFGISFVMKIMMAFGDNINNI